MEQYICRFRSFREKLFLPDLNEQEKVRLNPTFTPFIFISIFKEEMIGIITELDKRPEMSVKDAANSRLGQRLVSLFTITKPVSTQINPNESNEVKNQFLTPAGKEYILRASIARPSQNCSRPSPQRMYCMLAQDEFRLCGAFSEDTTFF